MYVHIFVVEMLIKSCTDIYTHAVMHDLGFRTGFLLLFLSWIDETSCCFFQQKNVTYTRRHKLVRAG